MRPATAASFASSASRSTFSAARFSSNAARSSGRAAPNAVRDRGRLYQGEGRIEPQPRGIPRVRVLAHAAVTVRDGAFERQQLIGDRRRGVDHARAGERRGIDPGREPGAVDQDEIGLLVERDGLGVGLPERRIGAGRRREAHAGEIAADALREVRERVAVDQHVELASLFAAEPPAPPSPAPHPRTASDASTTIDRERAHPDHGFSCASPVIGTKRTGATDAALEPVRRPLDHHQLLVRPSPTGTTSTPPAASWSISGCGISGGAAVRMMASNGACSGQPSVAVAGAHVHVRRSRARRVGRAPARPAARRSRWCRPRRASSASTAAW